MTSIAASSSSSSPNPSAALAIAPKIDTESNNANGGNISQPQPQSQQQQQQLPTNKNGKPLRYIYKRGFIVADDVVRRAMGGGELPMTGAWLFRLRKPVPCVFVSVGHGGIMLPDTGVCVIGETWNAETKDELFSLHRLMSSFDPDFKLKLRSQWMLVDLVAAEGRVLKRPSDIEIARLSTERKDTKDKDLALYKMVTRVQRRRTTSGADLPDGHEDDSDRDPVEMMLEDLAEREKRSEKARLARLGGFPDTPIGRQIAKLFTHKTGCGEPAAKKPRRTGTSKSGLAAAPMDSDAEEGGCGGLLPTPFLCQKSKKRQRQRVAAALAPPSQEQPLQRQEEDLFGDAEDTPLIKKPSEQPACGGVPPRSGPRLCGAAVAASANLENPPPYGVACRPQQAKGSCPAGQKSRQRRCAARTTGQPRGRQPSPLRKPLSAPENSFPSSRGRTLTSLPLGDVLPVDGVVVVVDKIKAAEDEDSRVLPDYSSSSSSAGEEDEDMEKRLKRESREDAEPSDGDEVDYDEWGGTGMTMDCGEED